MGRIMTKFEKYTVGRVHCILEEYNGTGCYGCPYSADDDKTSTCKAELENDELGLKHIIFSVEALIGEVDDNGS